MTRSSLIEPSTGLTAEIVKVSAASSRPSIVMTSVWPSSAKVTIGTTRVLPSSSVISVVVARHGHDLAGADLDQVDGAAVHALDLQGVGAGAEVDRDLLDVVGLEGDAADALDLEVVAGRLGKDQVVVAGRGRQGEDVAPTAALDRREVAGGRDRDQDAVVAQAAVDVVQAAAAVDLVAVGAAVERVGPVRRAEQDVVAVAAVERRAAGAVVDEEVAVVAAVDGDGGARRDQRARLDVVVAAVAVQAHDAGGAVVQDRVVVVAAVQLDVREHALADDDRVLAVVGVGDDLGDAAVDLLAAHAPDLHGLVAGRARDVLDDEDLVVVGLGPERLVVRVDEADRVLADAAAEEAAFDRVGAQAHVQPQLAAVERRAADGGGVAVVALAGQVHRRAAA